MQKKFSSRVFVSYNLLIGFIVIVLTGIVLYIKPPGRDANWVIWTFMSLTKSQWEAIHTIFSIQFIIFGIVHVFIVNWKALSRFSWSPKRKVIKHKREIVSTTIISLLIGVLVILEVPPLSSIMDIGGTVSNNWLDKEEKAPLPNAESMTLRKLATFLPEITEAKIQHNFRKENIKHDNLDMKLKEIARDNNITPSKLFEIIARDVE